MGKRTSFSELAHKGDLGAGFADLWVTKVALSSCRSSSCLPSITQRPEMPASPQRVPVVLQSVAQRFPYGSAARGEGGAPSLRVTHALAISFVRPAPARGCGRGRGFGVGGAGALVSLRALSCGHGAPGTRGRPTRTASRRPRSSWIRCGGNVLAAWLLQGSKQSSRPWGGMWSPAGVAPRLVFSEGPSL